MHCLLRRCRRLLLPHALHHLLHPGGLFRRHLPAAGRAAGTASAHATQWLKALGGDTADRFVAILSEKPAGARGGFADALDALEGLLHDRLRSAVDAGGTDAPSLARAQDVIESARERTGHNVNPALITAELLRELRLLGING